MEGGFVAHSGWRHPLLDVSRIRLQASRRCSASQDELDLDAAVVPFWHLCPGVQRMEMETVAGTIRREGPLQYQHLLHLPVLCSESCNSSCGRVCQMRRIEEMGWCFVSESLGYRRYRKSHRFTPRAADYGAGLCDADSGIPQFL